MTPDELLAEIDSYAYVYKPKTALRKVVELCKDKDETAFHGDKAIFNSGRNSMRDEIIQAIEKELK